MAAYDAYIPRMMADREQALVDESLREFAQLQTWRNVFAGHWEEVAELILPEHRNTFFVSNFNWPGQKKTDRQVDATGMMALHRFAAICDSLLTPRNMQWHGVRAMDDYVMKDRATKLWFEQVTRALFKYRYAPNANFTSQNQNSFLNLGAFGNQGMFVDEFDTALHPFQKGLRYQSMNMGELFVRQNHQGLVDGFIRWFKMSARQAWDKWGAMGTFPPQLMPALQSNSELTYNFIHRVCPRTDYDPDRLDYRGKAYASYYISLEGRNLLQEGGYRKFPAAISRYEQAPGEVYGRSPAMMVLPALKTLNAQKRTFLKAGHRAADPVLLTADDGIVDMSLRPGAMNKGGVTADGKELVKVLPVGNVQITKEMMAEERTLINDAFLVTLFQILTETPQMTATEVIERTNEKGILLAPTVGRQQSEYLGPLIERELDLLVYLRLVPPMPPRLKEAKSANEVVYTSPLARAMRAQEAAGFIRSVEISKELVAITQDPSHLDWADFDTAMPAIAEIEGVPVSWTSNDDQIAEKRRNRQQMLERQQQIQAAPAEAALMKARAAQAKAGMVQPAPAQAPAQAGRPLAEQGVGA